MKVGNLFLSRKTNSNSKNTYIKNLLLLFLFIGAQSLSSQSFYDDFSYNNNNWYTVSKTQEFFYSNGQLKIEQVRKKSGFSSGSLVNYNAINQRRNFKISCEMRLTKGVTGNGIVWNFKDGRNNYRFLITDRDGKYAIYKIENGSPTAIKKWGYSDSINKKFATNKLSVEHRNGQTFFYINDSLVFDTYLDYDSNQRTYGVFLGEGSSFGILNVDSFRLEYNGSNSNNGNGEQDRAPSKY